MASVAPHATPSNYAALLAPLANASPATFLLVERNGRIAYANRGLKGEPGEAVLDRMLLDLVAPEHRERVRVALGGRTESFELGERGPAGPVRWWRVDAGPAGDDAVLLVFCDITAGKREEERLRRSEALLVDAQGVAHMGTWEWEITQPTAVWSQEMYRIYGLTPEEYTPSYEGYLKMVHPDDRARVMAVTEACFKEHTPYSHDERIFRKNGEMRWLHTWAIPILDAEGKLVRLLGVCQDVTEQKKAEGAMRAQMMTRGLARRLLHDLIQRAHVSDATVRAVGRGLAQDRPEGERTLESYAEAFSDMGFGTLRSEGKQGERYHFSAVDLLERRAGTSLPSCFLTLGYLEGAVTAVAGKRALGTEMRCQSTGHHECRFVVMLQ